MTLSRDEWVLVISMACAECAGCGGCGSIMQTHRRYSVRSGRRRQNGSRIRAVSCIGCKNLRRLLEQIGVPAKRVDPESVSIW